MYAFLQTNMNYLNKNEVERKFRNKNKRLDMIKVEIQHKKKRIEQTPDIFSSGSESSSDEYLNKSANRTQMKLSKEDKDEFVLSTYQSIENKVKGDTVYMKLNKYKTCTKTIDLIIVGIALSTIILILMQNLECNSVNLQRRLLVCKLAQCIDGDKIYIKNGEVHELNCSDGKYLNPAEFDEVFETENYLAQINFTNKDVYQIPLNFIITDKDKFYRYLILILTCITIVINFINRKFEHYLDTYYSMRKEKPFVKSWTFYMFIIETIILLFIPYPKIKRIFFYKEIGLYVLIPLTTYLATLSFFRIIFVIKILRSVTRWTSIKSDYICQRYSCNATEGFAFKAFQKEHPFVVLFFIFVFSCLVFGYSMKNFERLYWEHQDLDTKNYQSWNFIWNCFWFVFVSMTTVGYGDFYPKTTPGRLVSLICCLVGCYFVSSMMVFMTSLTTKSEKEEKAFRLIARIEQRNKLSNYQSKLIILSLKYCFVKQALYKAKYEDSDMEESQYMENELKYIKKKMQYRINQIENLRKNINGTNISLNKEQLFDVYERIMTDIENVHYELNFLEIFNNSMKNFTNAQLRSLENIKKDFFATQMFYGLVRRGSALLKPFRAALENEEVMNILRENEGKQKKSVSKFVNRSPQEMIHETGVTKVDEVNESQEEDNDIGEVTDRNQLIQNFGFLFEEVNDEKKSSFKRMAKTKQQYRDVFDKLEMRKVERVDRINVNNVKKVPQKKYEMNEIEEKQESSESKKNSESERTNKKK